MVFEHCEKNEKCIELQERESASFSPSPPTNVGMVFPVKGKEEIERKKARCLAGVARCRILARVAMCVAAARSLPCNGRIPRSPNIGRGGGGGNPSKVVKTLYTFQIYVFLTIAILIKVGSTKVDLSRFFFHSIYVRLTTIPSFFPHEGRPDRLSKSLSRSRTNSMKSGGTFFCLIFTRLASKLACGAS